MKNKTLTYALLLVVAGIWYQVFFRVKNNLFGDDGLTNGTNGSQPTYQMPNITRDTFVLNANYRDPFETPKERLNPTIENQNNVPEPRNIVPVTPQFVWPQVQYFGQIRKTNSNNPLAIINIDDIQLTVREQEEIFNEIYVRKIWRDSILIQYKKNQLIIAR